MFARSIFEGVSPCRRVVASFVLAGSLLFCRAARATDPHAVEWSDDWPRVHAWEAIDAVVLTVGDTLIEVNVPIPSEARWRGGVLFDDWARRTFRGRTAAIESTASTVSDALYQGGTLVPYIVDVYTALVVHESADVALEVLVINQQALSLAGLVSLGAEHGVGRARPYEESCGPDGQVRDAAGNVMHQCGNFRSFFSGHATAVATMAGLTCAHHQHLPLFGGGVGDLAPCVVSIGVAGAAGVLRLVMDEHWASDVLTGWAVGAAFGYVMPSLLHYGFGGGHAVGEVRSGGMRMVPVVQPYAGGAGVGVVGTF